MFVLYEKRRQKLLTLNSTSNFTLLNIIIFLFVSLFYWKGSVKKCFFLFFIFLGNCKTGFKLGYLKTSVSRNSRPLPSAWSLLVLFVHFDLEVRSLL